ncbi:MAG: streptomycin biosynthesis enzyme StrG [Gemmatimonadetes bacterium]|nr:streptomycin biosynthesis enzyme StrG [Gemmatimonadota bacterium]
MSAAASPAHELVRAGDRKSAMHWARLVPYDTGRFPFARVIAEDVFGTGGLEDLHRLLGAARPGRPLTHGDNFEQRGRIAALGDDSRFYAVYHAFVLEVVAPLFAGRISYSRHPTFRVHFPGTGAVSDWHRDADVTGRWDQINVWVPFVDTAGTSTIWVESHYGRGDHAPVPVRYGQALLFDGGALSHGSVRNDTAVTRVSMDLRIAPMPSESPHPDLGILALRPPGLHAPGPPAATNGAGGGMMAAGADPARAPAMG